MIIPVWQELYQSTHLLAQKVGLQLGEVATHTGTLDPMAEGIIVVLTGDDRFSKGKLNWEKEYEFEILWGIQTDSGDRLGPISEMGLNAPSAEMIEKFVKQFPTTYDQIIPAFSARRWQGISGFDAAKQNIELPVKTRKVTLSSWLTLGAKVVPLATILEQQAAAVGKVQGEFRQDEVIESWQTKLGELPSETQFVISRHSVRSSPGTYIRQLVQDLASKIGMPAVTWSITRTKNGPYSRADVVQADSRVQLLVHQDV